MTDGPTGIDVLAPLPESYEGVAGTFRYELGRADWWWIERWIDRCCGQPRRRVIQFQRIERACGRHAQEYRYHWGWVCLCCGRLSQQSGRW